MKAQDSQSQLAQPSTEDKKYPYFYFTTVNRRVDPYDVKDQELYDSVNWWTEYQAGGKRVRPGYTPFMDRIDNNPVTGFAFIRFPNGYNRLARISGPSIYTIDPNVAATWGAPTKTIADTFVAPDSTILQAICHIVTQVSLTNSHYLEWINVAGVDSITDTNYLSGGGDVVVPYRARCCQEYHRRVYVGSPYDASGLYGSNIDWSSIDYVNNVSGGAATPWSEVLDDVSTANLTPIDSDYKGSIRKLTTVNDMLAIYKQGGVYLFNESSIRPFFGLSPYQGSIANMDENQTDYFFTNEGFFSNNGQAVNPVGEGWYPIIKQILANGIDMTKIRSLAINFLYFCFMGNVTYDGNTINNAMWVYNAYFDELSLWSMGHQITALGSYVDLFGNKQVVMGDVNGFTYKLDYSANDDAGIAIQASMKSKYFFFDEPDKQDQLSEVYGFTDPFGGELELSFDQDFNGEYKFPWMSMMGFKTKQKRDPSYVGGFNMLSFKVYWNGRGTRPGFYGIILNIKQDSERIQGKKGG